MTDKPAAAEKAAAPLSVFPLKHPFTLPDGKVVTELHLKRAKGKDILALEAEAKRSGSNTAVTMTFLASVNGMKLEDLGEIDAEDLLDVSERVLDFLPEKLLKAAREA